METFDEELPGLIDKNGETVEGGDAKPDTDDSASEISVEPIDLTADGDGGVLKEILTPGKGWEKPSSGDKVTVHYVGQLTDGTVFDSSRDRDSKFSFTLGKGEVIRGWDIAIKTMKRGEKSRLTLQPGYAYGNSGNGNIPADAVLIFEVELFDWRLEDLTKKKDGGVTKSIISDGEGYLSPNEGSSVEVTLLGKVDDIVFDERTVRFIQGEGSEEGIFESVELAISKMKLKEKALVYIKRDKIYGSTPKLLEIVKAIPEDCTTVTYTVELLKFEKMKEAWELDDDERLQEADLAKTKGTRYFKEGKYLLALKQYKRIPKYIGPPNEVDENTEPKINPLRDEVLLAGYLNLSLTYLKLNKTNEAIKNSNLALSMSPTNEKALFRRGEAYLMVKEYELAKTDFETVLKIDATNKVARSKLSNALSGIKEQIQQEKILYRNMFDIFATRDKRKETDERRKAGDVWGELKNETTREFKE